MQRVTPCPDVEDLRRFLLGLIGAPAGLEDHFVGCPSCARLASTIAPPDDDLLADLRELGRPGVPDVPDGVVDRLCRMAQAPAPTVAEPVLRMGPYRVEGLLGRGGMGAVYLARHDRVSRPVALKVMVEGATPERLLRFRREAQVVAGLRHPNLVQVFEVGEDAGRPYFVMEYVPGGTLADRLATGLLAAADAATVVMWASRAVHAAHSAGVVHRDLKPSNILLDDAAGGPFGCPKVGDFGLARQADPTPGCRTETGVVIGTPGYMAPEQVSGGGGAPAADVYGLGAVLYECLTGRPPVVAATPLELLEHARGMGAVPPRRLRPAIPRDLETICLKCLEASPPRRYPSAAALADDLGLFLTGAPVTARRPGPWESAWRWARRRPTAATLVAAGALFGLAIAVTIWTYTDRLQIAAKDASDRAADAKRERERANAQYRSAREALRRMVDRLDRQQATTTPGLRSLRVAQLEEALRFYQEVQGSEGDRPEVRLDAARAATDAGMIQLSLGRRADALRTLDGALASYLALPDDLRARPDCREGLVLCYGHLANAVDDPVLAVRHLGEACAEAARLAEASPDDPPALVLRSSAENNLGINALNRQKLDEAFQHLQLALSIRDRLAGRPGQSPSEVAQTAEVVLNLAEAHSRSGRVAEADQGFQRAERLLLPLHVSAPTESRWVLSLVALNVNWGNLLRFNGRFPECVPKYDAAVRYASEGLRLEPEHALARQRATEAHGARAFALTAGGRPLDAVPDWDALIRHVGEPQADTYRSFRILALAMGGRLREAAGLAHGLAGKTGLDGGARYNLACVLALAVADAERLSGPLGALAAAAAAECHAERAVGVLTALEHEGYFRPPDRVGSLAQDDDFTSLRGRADFRALTRRASEPKKP